MNRLFHVTRTPGLAEGVQFSFIEELREALKATTETEVQIKISGDGAKVSKMCHFTTLSFTIMCSEEKHVHPLAIIKALELYEMLEISCKGVFDEINSVIESGKIRPTVNEKEVSVKIFLSADYKFLLLLMGLSGATASHECLWCIVIDMTCQNQQTSITVVQCQDHWKTCSDGYPIRHTGAKRNPC